MTTLMDRPEAPAALQLGDHVCVRYSTDVHRRELLTSYVRDGVRDGHRVLAFLDDGDEALWRQIGAAVPDSVPGQVTVLRYGRPPFDVQGSDRRNPGHGALCALVTEQIEHAFRDGFRGVRLAGDMIWTQRAGFTASDVSRYEAAANRLFADGRVMAMCLYDRRRFTPPAIAASSAVHPGPLLHYRLGGWGAHLTLTGEVDASNSGSLSSVLGLVAGVDGVVLLDASGLGFLDAAGAARVVRFAAARPHRHTVVRCTAGVRQTLELVGADSVRTLVLREGLDRV